MDFPSRRGDPVNKGLMALNAILVLVDQLLQPLPTARGAIQVDDLKPVRSCVNQRLPTLRIERDALDLATAPFVNDWHAVSFDLVRVEERLIVLRAMGQRECQHVRVPDQQAQNALRLLLARKLRTLLASLLIPHPPQPFRGHDGIGPGQHRTDEAIESVEIHRIFQPVLG